MRFLKHTYYSFFYLLQHSFLLKIFIGNNVSFLCLLDVKYFDVFIKYNKYNK